MTHVLDQLRGDPDVLPWLAGVIDARIRLRSESEGDADARRRKVRGEATVRIGDVLHPTKNLLRSHPELKELLVAASESPKAPPSFKAAVQKNLRSFT